MKLRSKIDCLSDIVGGIGLSYNSVKNVHNYILLRCGNTEFNDTLKKCYIVAYFVDNGNNNNNNNDITLPNS